MDPCVSKFYEVVSSAIVSHVPMSGEKLDNFPKCYAPELNSLIIDKKSEQADFKNSHSSVDSSKFKLLRTKCFRLSRSLYKKYVESTEHSLKRTISIALEFWTKILEFCKTY